MNKILTVGLACLFVTACSANKEETAVAAVVEQEMNWDVVGELFYNEFIPCTAGHDFSEATVDAMVSEWRVGGLAPELLGAWGYVPATKGRFDNGWWELSWESKEAADAAWAEWVQDEEAMAFLAANESVLVCNGEERAAWDMTFHRDVYSFGPMTEDGSFFT